MNLYDRRGYLNITDILKCKQTFIFVVCGRGTGKTLGTLREARRGYRATGARFSQDETSLILDMVSAALAEVK